MYVDLFLKGLYCLNGSWFIYMAKNYFCMYLAKQLEEFLL